MYILHLTSCLQFTVNMHADIFDDSEHVYEEGPGLSRLLIAA